MKQPIRFFSMGLLSASLLLLVFYFFFDSTTDQVSNIPVEEMITNVEQEGYRVITEDEFISYSLFIEEQNQSETKTTKDETKDEKEKDTNKDKPNDNNESNDNNDKSDKDKDKEEKEEVEKLTFTIEAGVVTPDIADILIENDIIEDRQKFIDFLEDNDYSSYIQLGTFEVTSDMSSKEIAEIITTYPGN